MKAQSDKEPIYTHSIHVFCSDQKKLIKEIMCTSATDASRIRNLLYQLLNVKLKHKFSYHMIDFAILEKERAERERLERDKLNAESEEKAKKIQQIIELQEEVAKLRELYNEMIGSRFGRNRSKIKAQA